MNKRLLNELISELLAPPPKPYRPVETAVVKRRRLKQLDRDLNPQMYARRSSPAELDFLTVLGGRICDLSALFLDMLATRSPATAEIRKAQRQISHPERQQRNEGT